MKYTKQLQFGFDDAEALAHRPDKPIPPKAPLVRQPDRLLRMCDVMNLTGLSRRMIYRLISQQRFPQQYKPGGWSSRWSEAEIIAWRESQRA